MSPTTILNLVRLPARLDYSQAATLLNFPESSIPILARLGLLTPLGHSKIAPNAVKYLCTARLLELAQDEAWLSKATAAIYRHHQTRNGNAGSRRPQKVGDSSKAA